MSSLFTWESKKCAECGCGMKVMVTQMGGGFILCPETEALERQGKLKGTFRCTKCGRYYCFDCSHIDKTCKCGQKGFSGVGYEGVYIEEESSGWLSRLLGG